MPSISQVIYDIDNTELCLCMYGHCSRGSTETEIDLWKGLNAVAVGFTAFPRREFVSDRGWRTFITFMAVRNVRFHCVRSTLVICLT
jgi:hypothetical protein